MKKAALFVVCGAMVLSLGLGTAQAIPPFSNEFKAMYITDAPSTPAQQALSAELERVKCNVCHVGTSKKDRNAYGEALNVLLDKKEDAKNVEKIQESLRAVESQDSGNGATYGSRLAEGKLPVEVLD